MTVAKRVLRQYEAHTVPSEHIPTRRTAAEAKYAAMLRVGDEGGGGATPDLGSHF